MTMFKLLCNVIRNTTFHLSLILQKVALVYVYLGWSIFQINHHGLTSLFLCLELVQKATKDDSRDFLFYLAVAYYRLKVSPILASIMIVFQRSYTVGLNHYFSCQVVVKLLFLQGGIHILSLIASICLSSCCQGI